MKHKKLIAALASILLFCGGVSLVKPINLHIALAAQTNTDINYNNSEDFNAIKGHDDQHPIWPANHLGVFVESSSKELQDATQKACAEWAPAFKLNYEGQVRDGASVSTLSKKDKRDSYYIVIRDTNLPYTQNEHRLGDTEAPDTYHGWITDSVLNIRIDLAYINARRPTMLQGVIAHELGHAIGLKHSTNPIDLMYWETDYIKSIQPEELALVRRLYDGQNYTSYASKKSNNNVSSSSKPKKQYKGYYFGNRTPLAVYNKILSHLFLIDGNNKIVGNSCTSYAYHTLYHGRHIGTKSQLHNGTYMGKIPLRITGIKPKGHLRSLSAVFTRVNGYSKGDTLPDRYILSYHNHIKIKAHSRRSRLYTFYVLFRVRGHYFKLINEN